MALLKLQEAYQALAPLKGRRFSSLFEEEELCSIRRSRNKGIIGQLLERCAGLALSTRHLDFDDGELKSYKSNESGMPKETMAITQIGRGFDALFVEQVPYSETSLAKKIENMLVIAVCKDPKGDPGEWFIPAMFHIMATQGTYLHERLAMDLDAIRTQVGCQLSGGDGCLHTANGHYIQIRTKDSKDKTGSYHPIRSERLGRLVSNKGFAFYFRKQFMEDLVDGTLAAEALGRA